MLDHLNRAGSEAFTAVASEVVHDPESMPRAEETSSATVLPSDESTSKSADTPVTDIEQPSPKPLEDSPFGDQGEKKDIDLIPISTPSSSALDLPFSPRLAIDSPRVNLFSLESSRFVDADELSVNSNSCLLDAEGRE